MNPSTQPIPATKPVDQDLVDQAHPGHGIPSQDTSLAAQQSLDPEEAEREAGSVLAGGGALLGAAAGAAVGTVMAGPVGAVIGSAVGAVAGALGGVAAGPLVSAGEPDAADAPAV
jgi:phage tail tape-measure protein